MSICGLAQKLVPAGAAAVRIDEVSFSATRIRHTGTHLLEASHQHHGPIGIARITVVRNEWKKQGRKWRWKADQAKLLFFTALRAASVSWSPAA